MTILSGDIWIYSDRACKALFYVDAEKDLKDIG